MIGALAVLALMEMLTAGGAGPCDDSALPRTTLGLERSTSYSSKGLKAEFWESYARELRCRIGSELASAKKRPWHQNCGPEPRYRLLIENDRDTFFVVELDVRRNRLAVTILAQSVAGFDAPLLFQSSKEIAPDGANLLRFDFEQISPGRNPMGLRPNPFLSGKTSTHAFFWVAESCIEGKYGYAIYEAPVAGVGGADAVGLLEIARSGFEWSTNPPVPAFFPRPE